MIDSTTLFIILAKTFGASLISIRLGVSVAIIEIILGMLLGNAVCIESACPCHSRWSD